MEINNLIQNHHKKMVAIACRMLGNLEDAKDKVQDAFIKLWQYDTKHTEGRDAYPLLYKILVHLCLDELRRRKRKNIKLIDVQQLKIVSDADKNPHEKLQNTELRTHLERAIEKLKPKQKAIFVLRDLEDYSVRQTAEILGCSENNILVNLCLARKNLRKALSPFLKIGV